MLLIIIILLQYYYNDCYILYLSTAAPLPPLVQMLHFSTLHIIWEKCYSRFGSDLLYENEIYYSI